MYRKFIAIIRVVAMGMLISGAFLFAPTHAESAAFFEVRSQGGGCEDCDYDEYSMEQELETAVRQVPYMPEGAVVSPRDDRPYDNISIGDSVVLYFYTPWCPFCYEISPIMNNLPEYVMVDGQKSYVRLISYNRDVDADREIIRRYHDMLNIAEERRLVPLVIIGYRDLFLYAELREGLIAALEAGEGLVTPLLSDYTSLPETTLMPYILVVTALAASILLFIIRCRKNAIRNSFPKATANRLETVSE
ncbi:MAG: thioredoxin family protein [Oscillospiraceae bacterium]|nr:thioredoxin family protein [Oscillospiraceae bacterium]